MDSSAIPVFSKNFEGSNEKSNFVDSQSIPDLSDKVDEARSIVTLQPGLLSGILKSLSDVQKKWINGTGFGSLLKFGTKEYPYEISYFILRSYQPDSSEIHVNGKSVKIVEEDVQKILGLPRGKHDINFLEDKTVFGRWILQFPDFNKSGKLLASTLCNAICLTDDVNEDFKHNFIVLMSNILIRGQGSAYVNTEMIQFAGMIDQCSEYNWCKYLLVCLKESWTEWNNSQDSLTFTGSIAFLLFFVLDCISKDSGTAVSIVPTFARWTNSDIVQLKIDKISGNISLDTSEELIDGDNDLIASKIIKLVCEDIERDFKEDEDATPEILITVLKEALEEYNKLQEKCMKHLSHASISYPKDSSVDLLKTKFINLHDKAIGFVSKQLVQPDIDNYMISSLLKNTYVNRDITFLNNHLQDQKNIIWSRVNSEFNDSNEVLFKWNDIRGCKIDFQSLNFGEMIVTSIIDVWCCLLSKMDSEKPRNQLKRIFCFIHNTLGIVNVTKQIPFERMYKVFEENLDFIFDLYGSSLKEIDLIFFPMFLSNHHYVVCYNLQVPSLEILDNRKSEKMVHELYGDQISVLHKYFTKYLEMKTHKKVMDIRFLIPERLEMVWQTKYNDIDCGMFAMRHMETYMGGGSDLWVTKIVHEGYGQMIQLNNMRIHFLFSMLTSELNEYRGIFYGTDVLEYALGK